MDKDKKADATKADATKADATKADAAKADASGGQQPDKTLAMLDSIADTMKDIKAHCDSLTSRMDSMEEEKKKERADAAAKADAAKADAEKDEKEDKKADAAKADADKKEDEKKADADKKEEDEKKADAAKADSDVSDLRTRLADLDKRLPRQLSDADQAVFADVQSRADDVFNHFGQRAPRPMDGETVTSYRRRLANKLKSHSPAWKAVNLDAFADDALSVAENQVYADAIAAAANPPDVEAGSLREIKQRSAIGVETSRFVGPQSFIALMSPPRRHVKSFNTRPNASH